MAQRILGMGDIQTLVDRAREEMGDQDVKELERKMKTAQFDLQDFLDQMAKVKKMGRISDLVGMLPGLGKIKSQLNADMDEGFFKKTEAIIQSMTMDERRNPSLLLDGRSKASRKRRIAKGSATRVEDVNELLRQFEQSKTLMKQLTSSKGRGLLSGLLR